MLINIYVQHHFQFLHGMPLYIYATIYLIYPLLLGNLFVWTLLVARNTRGQKRNFLPLQLKSQAGSPVGK